MVLGALAAAEILEHHGVKGMHWGVRRGKDGSRPIARALETSRFGKASVKNADAHDRRVAKRKNKVVTPPKPAVPKPRVSADAKRADVVKAKAAKGGTKSLSNKDLKDLNERLNLEQNYSRLAKGNSTPGAKAAKKLLGQIGQQQASQLGNQIAAKQIGKLLAKSAFAVLI